MGAHEENDRLVVRIEERMFRIVDAEDGRFKDAGRWMTGLEIRRQGGDARRRGGDHDGIRIERLGERPVLGLRQILILFRRKEYGRDARPRVAFVDPFFIDEIDFAVAMVDGSAGLMPAAFGEEDGRFGPCLAVV